MCTSLPPKSRPRRGCRSRPAAAGRQPGCMGGRTSWVGHDADPASIPDRLGNLQADGRDAGISTSPLPALRPEDSGNKAALRRRLAPRACSAPRPRVHAGPGQPGPRAAGCPGPACTCSSPTSGRGSSTAPPPTCCCAMPIRSRRRNRDDRGGRLTARERSSRASCRSRPAACRWYRCRTRHCTSDSRCPPSTGSVHRRWSPACPGWLHSRNRADR